MDKELNQTQKGLWEDLQGHEGSGNEITAETLGRPYDLSDSETRKEIKGMIEEFHLPIISTSLGFRIATSPEERTAYNRNLYKRILSIAERIEGANPTDHTTEVFVQVVRNFGQILPIQEPGLF